MRTAWILALTAALFLSSSCNPDSNLNLDIGPVPRASLKSDAGKVIGEENGVLALAGFQFSVDSGDVTSISDLIWETVHTVPTPDGESVSWQSWDRPGRGTSTLTLVRLDSARRGVTIELRGEYSVDGLIVETGSALFEIRLIGERKYYRLQRTITNSSGTRLFDGRGTDGAWGAPERGDDTFHIAPPSPPVQTGLYSARFTGSGTIGDEALIESLIVTVEFDANGRLVWLTDFVGTASPRVAASSTQAGARVSYVDYGADGASIDLTGFRSIPQVGSDGTGVPAVVHRSLPSVARLRTTTEGGVLRGTIDRRCTVTPQWVSNWSAIAEFERTELPPDLSGRYAGVVSGIRATESLTDGRVESVELSVPVAVEFDAKGHLERLTDLADPDEPVDVERGFWSLDFRNGLYTDVVDERNVAWVRYLNGGVQVRVEDHYTVSSEYDHSQIGIITVLRDGAAVHCRVDWTEQLLGGYPPLAGTWLGQGSLLQSIP